MSMFNHLKRGTIALAITVAAAGSGSAIAHADSIAPAVDAFLSIRIAQTQLLVAASPCSEFENEAKANNITSAETYDAYAKQIIQSALAAQGLAQLDENDPELKAVLKKHESTFVKSVRDKANQCGLFKNKQGGSSSSGFGSS